jgi:hypothetical protein
MSSEKSDIEAMLDVFLEAFKFVLGFCLNETFKLAAVACYGKAVVYFSSESLL